MNSLDYSRIIFALEKTYSKKEALELKDKIDEAISIENNKKK